MALQRKVVPTICIEGHFFLIQVILLDFNLHLNKVNDVRKVKSLIITKVKKRKKSIKKSVHLCSFCEHHGYGAIKFHERHANFLKSEYIKCKKFKLTSIVNMVLTYFFIICEFE